MVEKAKTKEKNNELVRLGVDLNQEASSKFRKVKAHLNIESNADVVRWLIGWYFDYLQSRRDQ